MTKAIESFLKSPEAASATQLPQNLTEIINEYTSEQNDFAKLHEKLIQLKQFVSKNNLSEALFLECVALLALKLLSFEQLNQWFKAYVNPAINSASYLNNVACSARKFFLVILKHGTHSLSDKKMENGADIPEMLLPTSIVIETPSQLYFYKIFQIYEGSLESYFQPNEKETSDMAERKRFITQNAKEILIEFGRDHPDQFFTHINKKFLVPKNRRIVLILISNILATHTKTDFSKVSNTPFLKSLYNCLLYDTSPIILSVGISVLVMLFPYNAKNISFLKLLVIFGRLVAWNTQTYNASESHIELETTDSKNIFKIDSENETCNEISDWKVLNEEFIYSDAKPIDLLPFTCFLYGLFPHNFLEFSRSPSTYLRFMGYCEYIPTIWNDEQIISVAKSLSQKFTLNTFLISYSQEQELNDCDRWNTPPETLAVHCLSMLPSENLYYDLLTTSKVEKKIETSRVAAPSTKSPVSKNSDKKEYFYPDEFWTKIAYEETLLNQHEQIYRKSENINVEVQAPTPTIAVPDVSSKTTLAYENPSVPFSLSSPTDGANNPLFISQTGPSSGITPITVSNSHQNQHYRKGSDLELLNFSPVTTSSSYSESESIMDDISVYNSFMKQQTAHGTDPYLLLYQKEICLLKSELDFKSYMVRVSCQSHQQQLELTKNDLNAKFEIENLKNLIKKLEKKNSDLELASKKDHSEYMALKLKNDTFIAGLLKDNKDQQINIKNLTKKLTKAEQDFQAACKNQTQCLDSLVKKQTKIIILENKISDLTETVSQLDIYKNLLHKANDKIAHLEKTRPNFMTLCERQQAMDTLSSLKKFEDAKNAAVFEMKNMKLRTEIERNGYKCQIRHEQEKNVISSKVQQSFDRCKKEQEMANETIKELKKKLKDKEDAVSRISDELSKTSSTAIQLKTAVENYEKQIKLLDQRFNNQTEKISKLKQKLTKYKNNCDWQDSDISYNLHDEDQSHNSTIKRSITN